MLLEFAGKKPSVAATAYIAESAAVIGDVVIGEHSSVWFNAVLRGDDGAIRIGSQTNIQDAAIIHDSVTIGDRVTIGHGALIHGCTIEPDAKVGMGAIILDRAVIGAGSIVAAGSVVLAGTDIPAQTLFAGSPATFKKHLSADQAAGNQRTAEHYSQLAEAYRTTRDK
jgi:carbonic anhydrase/acetyltransferase-like protein (isoleucine patch superfamily)